MRIISGKFKGRRLKGFNASHIRPTMDRVKETLFNILQNDVEGSMVLDLFAGTGSLGIEALSRGAAKVCMVESSPKSLSIIRENLQELQIKAGIDLIPKDVFRFLKQAQTIEFDLVFIDPPFTEALAHKVMTAMAESDIPRAGGIVAIEASKQERIDTEYPNFEFLDQRPFGDKSLYLFKRRSK